MNLDWSIIREIVGHIPFVNFYRLLISISEMIKVDWSRRTHSRSSIMVHISSTNDPPAPQNTLDGRSLATVNLYNFKTNAYTYKFIFFFIQHFLACLSSSSEIGLNVLVILLRIWDNFRALLVLMSLLQVKVIILRSLALRDSELLYKIPFII